MTVIIRLTMCGHGYCVYKCLETPVQSSDIYLIENLSSYLDCKIRNHTTSSKNDLKNVFRDEWGKPEPSFCEKFVRSMSNRLKMGIKNKAIHTIVVAVVY